MKMNLEEQIAGIFKVVFPHLSEEKVLSIQRFGFDDWDSLKQVEIATELEECFGIFIDDASLMKIEDFESTVNVVRSLL